MNIEWGRVITAQDKSAYSVAAERNKIAARRWQAENGGLTFAGVQVHTDERTRTNMLGAYQEAIENPEYSVQWKGADGAFVTLDAEAIIAVGKAIRAHVQACFSREAALLDALAAGDPYDIEQGWP